MFFQRTDLVMQIRHCLSIADAFDNLQRLLKPDSCRLEMPFFEIDSSEISGRRSYAALVANLPSHADCSLVPAASGLDVP